MLEGLSSPDRGTEHHLHRADAVACQQEHAEADRAALREGHRPRAQLHRGEWAGNRPAPGLQFGDAFGFVPIDLFRGFKHVRQFFTVDDFTLRVQVRPCILRSGLSDGDLFLFDAAEQLLACGPHLQVDPTLLRNARDSQAAPAQCFGLRGLTLAVDTNQDILGALRILRN